MSSYDATATWSGLWATGLEFLNSNNDVIYQSQFTHPLRNASITATLTTAPAFVELIGRTIGAKTPCTLVS